MAGPILYYDGGCALCHASVAFVLRHDRNHSIRCRALPTVNDPEQLTGFPFVVGDSAALLADGKWYMESEAILKTCELMGGAWRTVRLFRIVPLGLRNKIYRLIARNRHRWRRQKACPVLPSKFPGKSK